MGHHPINIPSILLYYGKETTDSNTLNKCRWRCVVAVTWKWFHWTRSYSPQTNLIHISAKRSYWSEHKQIGVKTSKSKNIILFHILISITYHNTVLGGPSIQSTENVFCIAFTEFYCNHNYLWFDKKENCASVFCRHVKRIFPDIVGL